MDIIVLAIKWLDCVGAIWKGLLEITAKGICKLLFLEAYQEPCQTYVIAFLPKQSKSTDWFLYDGYLS